MVHKRVHVIYSGNVQGVGFRWTAERNANSLGLTGWVRNRPDNTVELVCEGDESDIKSFLSKINNSLGHYIDSAATDWSSAKSEFSSFDIRFSA